MPASVVKLERYLREAGPVTAQRQATACRLGAFALSEELVEQKKKRISVKMIALVVLGGLLSLLLATSALVYLYQDKLISLFVAELNKHLKTPVQVDRIELSVWDKFPQASISITNPRVAGLDEDNTEPLLQAEKLFFTFSLYDLWHQRYQIKELSLENGSIRMAVDAQGNPNYLIYQAAETTDDKPVSFELEKITLKNLAIGFANDQTKQRYQLKAQDLLARLGATPNGLDVQADGQLLVNAVTLEKETWLREKQIGLHTRFNLDHNKQLLTLNTTEIEIQKAIYTLAGTVAYASDPVLDLKLDGKNTSLQGIMALLPEQVSRKAAAYRSSGQVYFNGTVKGTVSEKKNPAISLNFGCSKASFFHPDYKQKLENLSFNGTFTNGSRQNSHTSELRISGLKGTLQNKPFQGELTYRNFTDPFLALAFEADLDIASALAIFPVEGINEGVGQAWLKVGLEGKLADLKNNRNSQNVKASGEVKLKDASFLFSDFALLLGGVNGRLQVNKNDFALQDVRGKLGQSDFELNGYFRHAVAWLLNGRQDVLMEADLKSRFLNLDELLSQKPAGTSTGKKEEEYVLAFAPHLAFRLQSDVDRLKFRRLRGKHLRGQLELKNQVLSTPQLAMHTLGGKLTLKGSVDARKPNQIKTTTISRLEGIHLDSALYVFENFDQDFLEHKNVRGQLQAAIVADIFFDKHLNAQQNLLEADITASVTNGQLVNFEPLLRMSKFIDQHELANLRFSEISNHIQIYNRTIHMPEMEIYTSLNTIPQISIAGTHTLDQVFDYKVRLPLPRLRKQQVSDTPFGKVAQENSNTSNLFLTVKGTPDNFKVAYDKERVKEKIKQDIQKEKQELKDAIAGKEKPKKEVQLNEEEYFEF